MIRWRHATCRRRRRVGGDGEWRYGSRDASLSINHGSGTAATVVIWLLKVGTSVPSQHIQTNDLNVFIHITNQMTQFVITGMQDIQGFVQ